MKILAAEKEALGFHISGHPLDRHEGLLREFCNTSTSTLGDRREDATIILGGVVTRVRHMITKNGKSAGSKMARVTIADKAGAIDAVLFAESFAKNGHLLVEDALVIVVGTPDRNSGEPGIIVEQVYPLETAPQHFATAIELHLVDDPSGDPLKGSMQMAAGILRQAAAIGGATGGQPADVLIHLETDGRRVTLRPDRLRVVADRNLLARLAELFGPEAVHVRGGFVPQRERRRQFTPRPAMAEA